MGHQHHPHDHNHAHDHTDGTESHTHAHTHQGHHGHHHHGPANYNKAFAIAVGANLLFTLIEVGYALAAHSMSLLADAGHNFGDVIGLLFAWLASWLLTLKPGGRYSYGFKRTSILAALANALLLVFTSAIIVHESIIKLIHPAPVGATIIMIVATIGILVNGGTALLFIRGRHDDLNLKGAFLHLAYDALISVGVVVTGLLILWTHWLWLDPVVGLAIVVAILLGTWGLLRESVNLILDAVPHGIDHRGVAEYLQNIEGVNAVHDLHIWGLSTSGVALTAHLVVPDRVLSDEEFRSINTDLKQKFRIDHVTIQVEKGSEEHPCPQSETC